MISERNSTPPFFNVDIITYAGGFFTDENSELIKKKNQKRQSWIKASQIVCVPLGIEDGRQTSPWNSGLKHSCQGVTVSCSQ